VHVRLVAMEASSPPSQGGPEEEEGAAQVQLWDFPPDVLARLSEEMELRDVSALGASCRALRRVVETNNAAMWADTYRRHWPGVWTAWSPLQNPRASIGACDRVEVDWRRAFRWRFETTRQVCLPTTLSLAHSQFDLLSRWCCWRCPDAGVVVPNRRVSTSRTTR